MKRDGKVRALALLAALLLCGCAKKDEAASVYSPAPRATAAPKVTAAPAPTQTPDAAPGAPAETGLPAALETELGAIRDMIADGRCYEAFRAMQSFEEKHSAPAEIAACEELFRELDLRLTELEPATGTELARTFAVQGGGVLEVYAFTGPCLVTVTDVNAQLRGEANPRVVVFYVRQGERGSVHLPAGTYAVRYQVGYRWFGGEDGFGEYLTAGELEEPLVFDFYMSGGWASNSKYTITL